MMKTTTALILITFVLGCGTGTTEQRHRNTADAIIGGVEDTDDSSVIALFAHAPGESRGSLCTAEVIAPTVLLTAAHCVSPDEVGAGVVFEALFGPKTRSADRAAVAETHFDPQFDPSQLGNGHDVGIAILASPTSLSPLPYNRSPITDDLVGQPVRLVGYGLDDGTAMTGAGTKRQVTTQLDDYDGLLLHIGDDSTGETCNGDSGGPAFMTIGGVETIVGVTSFGTRGCTGGGYDTRVDDYTDFIDGFVNAAAGG